MSPLQRENALHALGMSNSVRAKRPYRNYFLASEGSTDEIAWRSLHEQGLAARWTNEGYRGVFYACTDELIAELGITDLRDLEARERHTQAEALAPRNATEARRAETEGLGAQHESAVRAAHSLNAETTK